MKHSAHLKSSELSFHVFLQDFLQRWAVKYVTGQPEQKSKHTNVSVLLKIIGTENDKNRNEIDVENH